MAPFVEPKKVNDSKQTSMSIIVERKLKAKNQGGDSYSRIMNQKMRRRDSDDVNVVNVGCFNICNGSNPKGINI